MSPGLHAILVLRGFRSGSGRLLVRDLDVRYRYRKCVKGDMYAPDIPTHALF